MEIEGLNELDERFERVEREIRGAENSLDEVAGAEVLEGTDSVEGRVKVRPTSVRRAKTTKEPVENTRESLAKVKKEVATLKTELTKFRLSLAQRATKDLVNNVVATGFIGMVSGTGSLSAGTEASVEVKPQQAVQCNVVELECAGSDVMFREIKVNGNPVLSGSDMQYVKTAKKTYIILNQPVMLDSRSSIIAKALAAAAATYQIRAWYDPQAHMLLRGTN